MSTPVSRAPLVLALLLANAPARAEDGVSTGGTAEEFPAFRRWSFSVGAGAEDLGPGFLVKSAYGFAPAGWLRIDARAWLGPALGSFSTAGMTFGGSATPADSPTGDLKIMRGGVEVAAAFRGRFLEPRLAVGWTLAQAQAETTYTVDTWLFGLWQNTASSIAGANGPCIAAGLDVVMTDHALLGFEIRKPFLPAVQLHEVPLRVELDSLSISAALTLRWGT